MATLRERHAGEKHENGDMVREALEMSKDYSAVSDIWRKKCLTWDDFAEKLAVETQGNRDCYIRIEDVEPGLDLAGNVTLDLRKGKLEGVWICDPWAISRLTGPGFTDLGHRLLCIGRDAEENELIGDLLSYRWASLAKTDGHRQLFLRCRETDDGRICRAILSDQYKPVEHREVCEWLRKRMSGDGLISHFQAEKFSESNGSSLRFNVLVPDSLSVEDDSEYGGMFTLGNNDVGGGRFNFVPSIFRAICLNGCIHSNRQNSKINMIHKGKNRLFFQKLTKLMGDLIDSESPLIQSRIKSFLEVCNLTNCGTDGMSLLGYIGRDYFALDKRSLKDLFSAYKQEQPLSANDRAGLIVNSCTRFSQTGRTINEVSAREEMIGSLVATLDSHPDRWASICSRATDRDYSAVWANVLAG